MNTATEQEKDTNKHLNGKQSQGKEKHGDNGIKDTPFEKFMLAASTFFDEKTRVRILDSLDSGKRHRYHAFRWKLAYKFSIIGMCFFSVIYLSYIKVLDGISTGSLIGLIIGYSLASNTTSSSK